MKIPERQGRRECSEREDWKTFWPRARRGGEGWSEDLEDLEDYFCGEQKNKDEIAEEEERKTNSCFLVSFLRKSPMTFFKYIFFYVISN